MNISKIQVANSTSGSLRATIPEEIVKLLNVKAGDIISWDVSKSEKATKVCIRKLE